MAHSRRAVALASGLLLAALTVRCDPQTFNLLEEYSAGAAGKLTGGRSNSNGGGTHNAGGMDGRGSGGKQSGGQFNVGGLSIGGLSIGGLSVGGFSSLTGGRANQPSGGGAGKGTTNIIPLGCGEICPGGCKFCTPGGNDNGGCLAPLLCPNPDTMLAKMCPVCVECRANKDCNNAPLTWCNEFTKTCTQPCSFDDDCTALPNARSCALDNNNDNGVCSECKKRDHKLCGPGKVCNQRNLCVDCEVDNDCESRDPLHPVCDPDRSICVECTMNGDCQFAGQPGGWCQDNVCMCNDQDQCINSRYGRSCVNNHCRECVPQQTCGNGAICDSSGKCPR